MEDKLARTFRWAQVAVQVGLAWSTAQGPALAEPVAAKSLIWSLQYEQADKAVSVTSAASAFTRVLDSPDGQDLRGRGDLATGEVGTRVDSVTGRQGQVIHALFDTLQFSAASGNPVTVSYSARYVGDLALGGAFSTAYAQYRVSIYDITGLGAWIQSRSVFGLFDVYEAVDSATVVADTNIFRSTRDDGAGAYDETQLGTFEALPGHVYGVRIASNSFASDGAMSDFYGTGSFRFTDLGGATFESGSGVFLSADSGTVDEPSLLVVAAMLSAAVARRRRVDSACV